MTGRRHAPGLLFLALFGCDVSPLSEIYDGGVLPADTGAPGGDTGVETPFRYVPSNFEPAGVSPKGVLRVAGGTCLLETASMQLTGDGCQAVPEALYGNVGNAIIVAAEELVVEADGVLFVSGNRAAVLAVFGDATIRGTIFAGAEGTTPGPGANGPSCDEAVEGAAGAGQVAGGGGGGGFGTPGGAGGSTVISGGGRGGEASGNEAIVPLAGGCDGARGGGGSNGGDGGRGGGAIQISATGSLVVSGLITAPGGGGGGGTQTGGGGGGGSGGAILLEAERIELDAAAFLTANGGGGGAGGDFDQAEAGEPGAQRSATPARGAAQGGGQGGAGGAGTTAPTNGEDGALGFGGGGGGGGAVGRVRLQSNTTCVDGGALVSPPAACNS